MTSILFVCTGGICRSPMAAIIATHLLEELGDFDVRNAGTLGHADVPTDLAVEVMAKRELDLSSWQSTPLADAIGENPDLIVTLTRAHAQWIVEQDGDLFARTFTLKELVRRAGESGARDRTEDLDSYLERISEGRTPSDLEGSSAADDIADPIGHPIEVYEGCASLIENQVAQMVELLWPSRPN